MKKKRLGILVGGGPAPGINSVISAATIRAILEGVEVVGILDGFKHIMRGDIEKTRPLTIQDVSRLHFSGGSALGIARDNPTKKAEHLEQTLDSLKKLEIDKLITIGGDDTAFSALTLEKHAKGQLRVVHVPKTIDNDLDLPQGMPTFGFQTARHVGVNLVKNLMVDAHTTSRWYYVISMGRKAGHLALGIGKAAGATLSIIPEEFQGGNRLTMRKLADILVGAMIKRLSNGRKDGVAILAEGLVELLDPEEIQAMDDIERDPHGHIRLAEINFNSLVKRAVLARLNELNIKMTIIGKNIGYELRCADPIPFDMEYTRDLGHCAAEFILEGGNAAMVSIQEGRFIPLFFKNMLDPKTGKTKIRMVDIESEKYKIGLRYMLRLAPEDFEDEKTVKKFAQIAGLSPDEFRKQFEYTVNPELPHPG